MIKTVTLDRDIYNSRSIIVSNIKERIKDWRFFECSNWYVNAQRDLLNLLSLYPESNYQQLCAICSALSPACSWDQNIKGVECILLEQYNNAQPFNYTTYGANVAKARAIASIHKPSTSELIDLFEASKTYDFFLCLLSPSSTQFVIDRHMLTIAGILTKGSPTKKQYAFIVDCYKEASKDSGWAFGAELQAWLWCAYQHYFKQVRHY